jgi:hypothetical protein
LWVIFALLYPDDPDPVTQINADPCGSGSWKNGCALIEKSQSSGENGSEQESAGYKQAIYAQLEE